MASANTVATKQPHGDMIVFVLKWIDEIAHPDWITEVAKTIADNPEQLPLHQSQRIEGIINYTQASPEQAARVKNKIMAIHGA